MHSSALLLILLFSVAATMSLPVQRSMVISLYGETIEVPCPYHLPPGDRLIQLMWKYKNDDGKLESLLSKHTNMTIHIDDPRVNISSDGSSLLISQGTLKDQGVYVCFVVSAYQEQRYLSSVLVYKKPAFPVIINKTEFLEEGKPTWLGTCVARDGHPAAQITWLKNGRPLVPEGTDVNVTSSVKEDSSTGLSTTSSSLLYTPTKQDVGARFSCLSNHQLGTAESEPLNLPVHYPTKRLSLTVTTPKGPIAEGADVTLTCHADGNPPPSSYNFHLKNQTVLVENSDSYTLTAVTRDSAGEYKCSLVDDETMEASLSITVSYLDQSSLVVAAGCLGMLVLVAVAGSMTYWIYLKKQQGSWTPPPDANRSDTWGEESDLSDPWEEESDLFASQLPTTPTTASNQNVQLKNVVSVA